MRGKAEGYGLIGRLRLAIAPLQQLREIERGAEASYWASRLEYELKSWIETVELYLKWMETLMRPPEETVQVLGDSCRPPAPPRRARRPVLHALASGHSGPVDEILTRRLDPGLPSEVAGWLNQLATEYQEARTNAARAVANLQRLAATAETPGQRHEHALSLRPATGACSASATRWERPSNSPATTIC